MGKRRVTLRDIADRTNVSVSTVSLVLNDKALDGNVRISEQTIRRVRRAAVEMGYLSRGIVGLIMPSIEGYSSHLIMGVMDVLKKEKYSLAMDVQTGWDLQQEIEGIHIIENKGFDCLIMAPGYLEPGDLSNTFQDRGRVVLMNWFFSCGIPYVTVNHERCGYLAAKHLLELGHRRIAVAGVHYPSKDHTREDRVLNARFQGYLKAMAEYDQPRISVERNEDVLNLLEEATAVYCLRARWAVELLNICRDRGVRVPDDLSIAGQDDTREKQVVRPPITTVDVHAQRVGRLAARMALDLIDGKEPESAIVEPDLIVRESTRRLS